MPESRPIRVESEIGPLKKVLLHRPGRELELLIPENLGRLLFDDIPYLRAAQEEHDRFAGVLREQGAEVVYLEDLTAETIAQSDEIKNRFIDDFIAEAGITARHYAKALRELLLACPTEKDLVLKTMAGADLVELPSYVSSPLARSLAHKPQFVMEPIPNLYFTRDPFAAIGQGVSINRMYSPTRNRETIYGRYIFAHHPQYRGRVPYYYNNSAPFSMEGGDILNLSVHVLGVGVSQRTTPEAVDTLAKNLFGSAESGINTVIVFDIPALRAFMHLDTVFTQLDCDKFTVHPEILEPLRLYVLRKKNSEGEYTVDGAGGELERVLSKELGLGGVTLVHCGGPDRVSSAREQWNDGANTLCVAPGTVVVYDRNYVTNESLYKAGVTVLQIPGSELSRGRGGPRCMSMPFIRDTPLP